MMLEVSFWNGTYVVFSKVDVVAALGVTGSVIGPPEFDDFCIVLAFPVTCSFTKQNSTWV